MWGLQFSTNIAGTVMQIFLNQKYNILRYNINLMKKRFAIVLCTLCIIVRNFEIHRWHDIWWQYNSNVYRRQEISLRKNTSKKNMTTLFKNCSNNFKWINIDNKRIWKASLEQLLSRFQPSFLSCRGNSVLVWQLLLVAHMLIRSDQHRQLKV